MIRPIFLRGTRAALAGFLRKTGIPIPALLMIGMLGFGPRLAAESVTIVRNNGPSANRVDLVVLGDGYTTAEMSKYASDVETFVLSIFNQEPLKEYANYFNVLRVDVVSRESGADKPQSSIYKDTALDATYYCGQIQRTVCVNSSKVNDVLSRSVGADQRDVILVLVNDSEYGGSGGSIGVASIHPQCVELILHEEGHTFGLLADEYSDSPPTCINSMEPSEVNVTREKNRDLIKWNQGGGPPIGWIDLGTPIPTTGFATGIPGLYLGARYCTDGLYRPTFNSKMRSLGMPFEQVNTEQLVKRIYNRVSGLDSWTPTQTELTLSSGQTQTFQVTSLKPLSHSLDTVWYVDGTSRGAGSQFVLPSSGLSPGIHTVTVEVHDPTPMVRSDPASVLTDSHSWTVVTGNPTLRLAAGDGGTTSPAPGNYVYERGTSVTVTAIPATKYRLMRWAGDVPAGRDQDNPLTVLMNYDVSLTAYFLRIIYPPFQLAGEKILNRSLSQAEYINILTWNPNPDNENIVRYRIYENDGNIKRLLAEVGAATLTFRQRNVWRDRAYTYSVAAVDNEGREGDPASVTVR